MFKRVSKCIGSLSGRLLSPEGESLEIAINTSRATELIPVSEIKINSSPGFRSHSLEYSSQIDCPSITHELFHLLGLVDEYDESDTTIRDFACRAPGYSNSFMTNQYSVIQTPNNLNVTSYEYCECPSPTLCTDIISKEECVRAGYEVKHSRIELPQGIEFNIKDTIQFGLNTMRGFSGEKLTPYKGKLLSMNEGRNRRPLSSILFPAHFRLITKPFCGKDNEKYNTCAKYAYISKRVVLGGMVLTGGDCPKLPDYCYNGEWLQ